jgi:hypothetical protein
MGPIPCPETSVKDYHSTLRYTAEERRSQVLLGVHLSRNFINNNVQSLLFFHA